MTLVEYIDTFGEVKQGKKISQKKPSSGFRFYDMFGALIVPILLGVVAGYYLDNYFQTGRMITLSGLILGIMTVIYNLIRLLKKNGR